MTQKEKQLLLVDLCARLPYGIIASVRGSNEEFQHFHILGVKDGKVWVENDILRVDGFDDVEVVKPYLRSMSSMTKAETAQLEFAQDLDARDAAEISIVHVLEFFLEHHLDYRGLIPMGLALEAPEGMYNTKQ